MESRGWKMEEKYREKNQNFPLFLNGVIIANEELNELLASLLHLPAKLRTQVKSWLISRILGLDFSHLHAGKQL